MTTISNPKNSNPPYFPGSQYNPTTNNSGGSTSTQSLVAQLTPYFLKFPSAQGQEFLSDVIVNGDLIVSDTNNQFVSNIDLNMKGNILLDSSANYIQFGDGTVQISAAPADDPYTVYADISNNFLSGTIQTFQGSNATLPTTAPLRFSNITSGEYGSLFVDPNPNNDLTIYSNQAGGGLTVANATNSFTINPTNVNTASFLNPIVSNASITGQSFGIATIGNDAYTIDSRSSENFGLTIVNSTGNNAELSLSNGGASVASITCTGGNALDFGASSLTTTGLTTTGSLTITNGLNTSALSTNTNGLTISDPLNVAGGVFCQEISCSTLNTNGNTLTTGTINAGAINGSQLTLINGASSTILTTSIAGLNVDTALTAGNITASSVFSSTGGINMAGDAKFASGSNSGGTSILSANQGLYITRNITNGLAEFDIVAMNNTSSTGINIYSSQGVDVGSTSVPEISISNTRTTINADLYVNPANTLYVNTIIPANTGPIQMAGGAFLATNPPSNSNDTTIATTSFVNTAIGAIPSGAVIQSGQINGCAISGSMGSAIGAYLQNDYIGVSTYTVNLAALGLQTYASNTAYVATACFSNINFSIANGFMQMLYGMWITVNTTSGSTFVITVYAPLHVNNPSNTVNGTPTFNLIWTTAPRLSTQ
jgi:hypothetical protein